MSSPASPWVCWSGWCSLIFTPTHSILALILVSLVIGLVLGIGGNAIMYALSGGRRDFTSVTQTVATKYEVLCEHNMANEARRCCSRCPEPAQICSTEG